MKILKKIANALLFLLKKIKAFFIWFLIGNRNKAPWKLTVAFEKHAFWYQIPLAFGLDFVIEWMSRHSFASAVSFVTEHPGAYVFNSLIIFAGYSLVFLTKHRSAVRLFVTGFFFILGLINSIILLNRVSPFGFTDLYMVGDLLTMQNSKYFSASQGVACIIGLVVFVLILIRFLCSGYKVPVKHRFLPRLILVAAIIGSLSPVTYVFQNAGFLASYFGNLAQGYLDYGYLYGFSTSILGRGMSRPLGYSELVIDRIVENDDMGHTDLSAEDGPNVIVVLLESFYDPSEANFISTDKDPIPTYHYLQENFSSGHLTVPVVGAGTCNSEFEVLTGMSCQFFGPGEYPQKTILKKTESCESVAHILGNLGYGTHVVHNNGGNFYSRANAFSQMGFDSFISKELLDITEYTPLGSWPTDTILIDATADSLDTTEGADFIYTITVGTHGAYPTYEVIEDPAIQVTAEGKSEEVNYQWEYYINQLHDMDQWISDYIDMLSEREEDTLLIMFGDHLPTLGLTEEEVATGDLFQTGYVTWNNFDMPKEDADLTSYQLVSEYLNRLNVHDGTILTYNQKMMADNVEAGSLIYNAGLQQLQYDLLYGNRYAYSGNNPYPASDLEMGVNDIVIDRMYAFGNKLYLYGENFTSWTKVYVNGEKVATGYKSGQVLTINLSSVSNGDSIVVNALGSSETIFRSSNEMIYKDPHEEFLEEEEEIIDDIEDKETEIEEELTTLD